MLLCGRMQTDGRINVAKLGLLATIRAHAAERPYRINVAKLGLLATGFQTTAILEFRLIL